MVSDTLTMNGTTFHICREQTAAEAQAFNRTLGLGLGLGIGVPVLIIMLCYALAKCSASKASSTIPKKCEMRSVELHPGTTGTTGTTGMTVKTTTDTQYVNRFCDHHIIRHIAELLVQESDELPGVISLVVSREAESVMGVPGRWIDAGVPADQRRVNAMYLLFKVQALHENMPILECFNKWKAALLEPPLPSAMNGALLQKVHAIMEVKIIIP